MLTERTLRQRIESILRADLHPIRRTKQLLRMSHQAQAFAHFMMKLGFTAHHRQDVERTKRFWAAAANFFNLAVEAREHARRALTGKSPEQGFGCGPSPHAVPAWEMSSPVAAPRLETTD